MGKDPSDIREEIKATRAELGETVEALAYKTDVRARVRDAVDQRVDTVKGKVSAVVQTVKGSVESIMGTAGDTMSESTQTIRETSADAASRAGAALGSARSTMADNALGIVGAAFAVGVLLGLALPVTQAERRRVGPLRDRLVERAQDAASEALERGRQVATDTAKTAVETALNSMQSGSNT